MTPIGQYHDLIKKACYMAVAIAVILSITLIFMALVFSLELGAQTVPVKGEVGDAAWISPVACSNCDWSVMQNSLETVAPTGELSRKFRLAGTFTAYGGSQEQRRAILDDIPASTQHIVSENEEIDGMLVVRIFTDRIVIKTPAGEEQLWLSFSNRAGSPAGKTTEAPALSAEFTEVKGKYGTQVGEFSWVLDRNIMMDYYNELMNEPQRLVSVFDSLKPIYDENHLITGYNLDVEGEAEFFEAIGWKQGDVVRAVNSMKMTSRHRAEYFIREFVANRANAFLFDVERDGEPEKLVYRIR